MATMETDVSAPEHKRLRKSRTQLVLIWVLFLLPPVSAWLAWKYLGEEGVAATTNAGTLISPARPLVLRGLNRADGSAFSDGELRGRWTYVLFDPGTCAEACRQRLYLTRQTRIAMSKDIPRVQRLLVLAQAPSAELVNLLRNEHEDLSWVVSGTQAAPLLQQFTGEDFGTGGAQYFLIDPLGNLMMYYDLDVPARGLMKDLQKLLKISQIG